MVRDTDRLYLPRPIHPILPRVISVRGSDCIHFQTGSDFIKPSGTGSGRLATTAGKSRGTSNCRRFISYSITATRAGGLGDTQLLQFDASRATSTGEQKQTH